MDDFSVEFEYVTDTTSSREEQNLRIFKALELLINQGDIKDYADKICRDTIAS